MQNVLYAVYLEVIFLMYFEHVMPRADFADNIRRFPVYGPFQEK
jgi:hypothetical protein